MTPRDTVSAPPDPFRLDGSTVAVIGAGSGIGEGAAEACARQGAVVACFDVNGMAARATADRIVGAGGQAEALQLDILDPEALKAALESLDCLRGVVATPGVNVRKRLLDYRPEEFDRVVTLNLRGAMCVLQAAGALLSAAGGGSIVLLSSIRSQVVEPGQGVYAATKAGIVQLARTAAAELGAAGVRVNALAPGVVDTPLTLPIRQNEAWNRAYAGKTALGRWGRADEIGNAAAFLVSDASSYVTGAVLFVDGGWTAIDGRFDPPA